jgi:hypothetical protein
VFNAVLFGGAEAVTFGSHLVVGRVAVNSCTPLMAHEMTHVRQAELIGNIAWMPAYLLVLSGTGYTNHPAEQQARAMGPDPQPEGWTYPTGLPGCP